MSPKDDGITPAVLLQHMQVMGKQLVEKIDEARTELKADINRVEKNLERVERKVDLALVQIGTIDTRLDDLEVVQVPKLKKAVGMR